MKTSPLLATVIRVVLLLLAGTIPSPARAAGPPNIVILLADDLGYSDLGCYGGEIATPNLDRLAQNGLRFTQFYNTARCWPSRAALMTGYYAQQIRRDGAPGLKGGSQGKRPDWARLLPDRLAAAGYRSYHSGKWHIDGRPLDNGFARSFQLEDHNSYFRPKNILVDGTKLPPTDPRSSRYVTVSMAEHAVWCLQEHAKEHKETPFLQFVAFTSPHFPLHALPEDIARYRETYRKGWNEIRAARFQRQKEMGLIRGELSAVEPEVGPPYAFPDAIQKLGPGETNRPLPWADLTEKQRAFQADKMAVHAAMVDRMDREIGKILEQLTAMGAIDNTLILFASDNGASAEIMVRGGGHDPSASPGSDETYLCLGPGWSNAANTPFRRHKTWVHEGGIATPLIVHWPARVTNRGALRHTPGHLIDVVPTVLDLAGANAAPPQAGPPLPGRSLSRVLSGDADLERPFLWWLHEGNRALRVGNWKIVAAKGDPWALYDLSTDRTEQNDLAKQHPDRLETLVKTWNEATEQFVRDASAVP